MPAPALVSRSVSEWISVEAGSASEGPRLAFTAWNVVPPRLPRRALPGLSPSSTFPLCSLAVRRAGGMLLGFSTSRAARALADSSDFQDTPGLPAALSSLREHYRRLALQLLGALAEGLGWQAQALAGPSAGSTTPIVGRAQAAAASASLPSPAVVALHYPAVARADVPAADGHAGAQELGAAMRAYPHADGDSVLTLLAHENVAGLQVLVRGASVEDDRWADVPEVPGGITVQLGQMLQRWTDDRLLATPHRVVLRPGAEGSSAYPARLTLAYFFQPPPDTALSPPGGGAVYEPVTAADFSKMARTDSEGRSLKLTSNILKDGLWVGQRGGGRRGPPDVPG
ncbi:unnamed protein product [Prorocentrum cordatum]|uniref:Fe2OG dioxygenase domain-containing protein n=1 Tax=Prorocentrum cordatum TaxID=2364126 RepID=A0ABN9U2A8_9DINO|nr:unnamed protein product [Polarella glacialis]